MEKLTLFSSPLCLTLQKAFAMPKAITLEMDLLSSTSLILCVMTVKTSAVYLEE